MDLTDTVVQNPEVMHLDTTSVGLSNSYKFRLGSAPMGTLPGGEDVTLTDAGIRAKERGYVPAFTNSGGILDFIASNTEPSPVHHRTFSDQVVPL
jgi:hypothetical protein